MSQDYSALLTSEYANSPNFIQTVQLTANAIGDITTLLQSLPAQFDIDNALGRQLDIVGQWIGFPRTIGGVLLVQFFGFADDATALTFGELTDPSVGGRFLELGENTSQSATLSDVEYKLLLKAKVLQNDWDGSVAEFEAAANDVLLGIPYLVVDPGTNVVLIMPRAALDPVLTQLLTGYDLLPRAAGVRYQFVIPQSGYAWTTAGTATTPVITTVIKASGNAAWDSAAWIASPAAHIWVQWTVPDAANYMMGGLSTNPSGSPNYPSLNFGLYTAAGSIQVWESGVGIGNYGTYQAGDAFAVYYDGKEAVYLHNGVPFKTTIKASASLAPMFTLYTVGAQANNIYISTG